MTINVWSTFSKRINSTKQPLSGTQKTVLLKDETDIENPTFILDTLDFSINYVEAFGHYYFAKCRNLDGHRTAIECEIDLLATYKSDVSGYTGFVEYTSASSDITITDPRNRPTCNTKMYQSGPLSMGFTFSSAGSYILGVIGKDANGASGVVSYYVLTPAEMTAFAQWIFANNSSIVDNIRSKFGSFMESIVSCIWVPFASGSMPGVIGSTEYIYIGEEHSTAVTGKPLTGRIFGWNATKTLTVTFPFEGTKGKTYLDKAPYSSGSLYLPFVGNVPLDVDALFSDRKITFDFVGDMITGDCIFDVMYSDANADYRTASYTGNFATKVPITGASYDGIGVASGLIASIGGVAGIAATLATGGAATPLIAGAGAALGGAASAFKSCELHTMINGSASSALGAALGGNISATVITQKPAETNLTAFQAEQGMPYFKTATLSSLSGFIKCSNASVSCAADEAEKNQINAYLNSGFYLE